MIARAPGKLFVTGAWAVLEGAPAIVLAVDRYVEARSAPGPGRGVPSTSVVDSSVAGERSRGPAAERRPDRPEVLAVARLLGAEVPEVDASSLERARKKFGLGSSAAAAVAATGAIYAGAGRDLSLPSVRDETMRLAQRAHDEVQPGGSGADVAACTFGGVVCARRAEGGLAVEAITPPRRIAWRALALHRPLRTSDALRRFAERRGEREVRASMQTLTTAAHEGEHAFRSDDPGALVSAARRHLEGLERLGRALDLPLVPPELARACAVLEAHGVAPAHEEFALLPSGAGGGDTVLWLGARAPSDHDLIALEGGGLELLDLSLDRRGVHSIAG